MEALGYTLAGDGTLHIHVHGKNKAVRPEASNYNEVMDAVREKNWDKAAELLMPLKKLEDESEKFAVVHGVMHLLDDDGERFAVPNVLGDEIVRYSGLGLDFERLLLFAKNLNMNPSRSSVQQLYGWLKETNLTLTEDGYFIAYKRVAQDFSDLRTGKYDNSPGKVVKMNRNLVDENPRDACSSGLHVATYDYAHAFSEGSGGHVVAVKVHPKDVVAVPNAEHQKMRTCEYLVLEESFAEIDRPTYEKPVDVGDSLEDEDRCEDCGMYELLWRRARVARTRLVT